MTLLCNTRGIKNARHLQKNAPHLIPRQEPIQGFASIIPAEMLGRLHVRVRPEELASHRELAQWLGTNAMPRPGAKAQEPLLNGTLIFVKITFMTLSGSVSVGDADMKTARDFAQRAAAPISRYASQYGPNALSVAPNILGFGPNLQGTRYNDQTLQNWVNAIAAQNMLPNSSCIVVLNPPGAVNTDADPRKGVGGYHSMADLPYCFVNVLGSNLTIQDRANVYVLALSHEIAEMAVDPRADLVNPEVCDPCGPNCQTVWIDYFDCNDRYIATTQRFPPSFDYQFFINGIVQPESATACPAPGTACNYPPP